MFEYALAIEKVIDGDTLKVNIDLGFHIHVKETLRLARINAPEMNTIAGFTSKAFVAQQIATAQRIKARITKAEKYGRWLAEIDIQDEAHGREWFNLNDLLIATNHATPYK